MNQLQTPPEAIPMARPLTGAITPVQVVPLVPDVPAGLSHPGIPPSSHAIVKRSTDQLAIASAVCGITALIPIVSQVLGLGLGIASLVRQRRAKRAGVELTGKGWAITGIVTSGIALIGWIALFAIMATVAGSLSSSVGALDGLMKPG